MIETLALC